MASTKPMRRTRRAAAYPAAIAPSATTATGVCPDNAVIKLGAGQRFRFNYDYCKGCGVCAQECPSGAVAMMPEEL